MSIFKKKSVAEVRLACGRLYLSVAGLAVAMEGDLCRDVHMAEIADEKDYVTDSYEVPHLVWGKRLLEAAAKKINNY